MHGSPVRPYGGGGQDTHPTVRWTSLTAGGYEPAMDEKGRPMRTRAVATVEVDNDFARVTRWSFAPGAETGWHVHAMDYVVVPLTNGRLRLETPDGDHHADLVEGRAYARKAGVEHNVVNANDHDFVFVEVEIRSGAAHALDRRSPAP